jgi:AcrR family transcriptional regulator
MPEQKNPGRKSSPEQPAPPKRPRGRPARLSRQAIIEQAMALLATRSADELTLTSVAAGLGTATMSLYNYFPNHEALLNAVADHAFSLFKLPKARPGQPWQEEVMAWLWALQRHCESHPVVFKMIGLEGQISAAWLKASAPMLQLLRDLGLVGEELAFACAWFTNHAIGLMLAEASAPAFRHPISLGHLEQLTPEEQELYLMLRPHLPAITSESVLNFGFRLLVHGIEQLLPAAEKTGR